MASSPSLTVMTSSQRAPGLQRKAPSTSAPVHETSTIVTAVPGLMRAAGGSRPSA
jgi:hypothetical protein